MTLQEYEASGSCEHCEFYRNVEVDTVRMACTFPWFDAEAIEWKSKKNCDELD